MNPEPTAEKLADEYGVSERTIRNNADFAEAVDDIPTYQSKDAPRPYKRF